MISIIDEWFSKQSSFFMTITDQWIGRPMDNIYRYNKSETCKEDIIIHLDQGWTILCTNPKTLKHNDDELRLTADTFLLTIPDYGQETFVNGDIRFFIELE